MQAADLASILIGIAGLFATGITYYRGEIQYKEHSSFYEYRLFSDKTTIKRLRREGLATCVILAGGYLVINIGHVSGITESLHMEIPDVYLDLYGIVMSGFLFANISLNRIIAFKESEWINKLIKKKTVFNDSILERKTNILFGYYLIAIIIGVIITCNNSKLLELYTYIVVIVGICVDGIYCSYVYTYLNLRLQFYVSEINLKARYQSTPYKSIINYNISKGRIAFLVNDKGILKRYYSPLSEVEYIEKIIDENRTLLNTKFKDG